MKGLTKQHLFKMTKICSKCGGEKDGDKFHYNQCNDCRSAKQKERDKKRRENGQGDYYGYAVGIVLGGDFKWLNYK